MEVPWFSGATRQWLAAGRHVEANAMRIFVYERGAGPAILLLHGFPTSGYDWAGVIRRLEDAYRCVAPDFIGFGLSDKPAAFSYSLFQQADLVEALARKLGIGEAHVVSHDMGTSVHTELLAREQEGRLALRVRSSTLLNGSMLQDVATITPFQKLLASNETLPQAMDICENVTPIYVDGLKAIMKRPESIGADDATVMAELLRYQDGNRRMPAIAGYMRERYLHRERWIGALRNTGAPLQFVWADGDPIANVNVGRALAKEAPQARYTELRGLGHFLLIEDPEAVAGHIRAFVSAT
jgi:pimeloyl-ACP methyl ester carboxylesterase